MTGWRRRGQGDGGGWIPKRDYYYASPLGKRLFQFGLGPATLAFIGAGSKDDVLAARKLMAEHGARWRAEWLHSRGLDDWAQYLDRFYIEAGTSINQSAFSEFLNGDIRPMGASV